MRGEPVVVIRGGEPTGGRDAAGNPIYSVSTEAVSAGWAVAPRDPSEGKDLGQETIAGYTLYRRSDADVRPTDLFRVRGEVWEVEGDISRWFNPYNGERRTTVILGRAH